MPKNHIIVFRHVKQHTPVFLYMTEPAKSRKNLEVSYIGLHKSDLNKKGL